MNARPELNRNFSAGVICCQLCAEMKLPSHTLEGASGCMQVSMAAFQCTIPDPKLNIRRIWNIYIYLGGYFEFHIGYINLAETHISRGFDFA